MNQTERKGNAVVSWLKNAKGNGKPYEDRYRMLTREVPLVRKSGRGEIVAVLDGIGTAPLGMAAAQAVADCLLDFYRKPDKNPANIQGLMTLLQSANMVINTWGCVPGTDRPLGGAAGTIVWIHDGQVTTVHAGDTAGILIRQGETPKLLTTFHEFDGGISRYFGLGRKLELEMRSEWIEAGDLILLLSDGVTKVISATEAANLVLEMYEKSGDIAFAVEGLVTRARNKRSLDDITAILVEVSDE